MMHKQRSGKIFPDVCYFDKTRNIDNFLELAHLMYNFIHICAFRE